MLPFENRTGQANLDWIGEAVPEILNQRLASAGFLPISRLDRQYALDHLGLPVNFRPSRATAIRIAQNLDADYIIVGSYTLQGQRFTTSTQILNVNALRMGQPLQQEADITRLLDVLNSTAWRVARSLDPQYSVAENTFVAAGSDLRLDGFENYIRGLVDPNGADRVRHLKEATRLNPKFSNGWLALGQAYFAGASNTSWLPQRSVTCRKMIPMHSMPSFIAASPFSTPATMPRQKTPSASLRANCRSLKC